MHTARTGLSGVGLDLDQYEPVHEVQTFETDTSKLDSDALAEFLAQLKPSYLAIIVSYRQWFGALTQKLVTQLTRCGAPIELQRNFEDQGRGFGTKGSLRFAFAGVCNVQAPARRATKSLFYTTDTYLGAGTIGSGSTSLTAVLRQVVDDDSALTLEVDPSIFWGSAIVSPTKYEYDASLTPTVTSVTPTISSTAGGATVTIKVTLTLKPWRQP